MDGKDDSRNILEVKDLRITFKMTTGDVKAIRGLNFSLAKNEVLALVGESGCGKSVGVKAIAGILPDNAVIESGEILYKDGDETVDLLKFRPSVRKKIFAGKKIAMIFQDPMTSLNPVMTIGAQLMTAARSHAKMSRKEAWAKCTELLQEVGITDPARTMEQYPHQLSGGMRQRVVIAIALSGDPDILICDEPTTALDVRVQAQILKLLRSLSEEYGVGILLISHDLRVIRQLCDRVAVMYKGEIVEAGPTERIFENPQHEYTKQLISAIPSRENVRNTKKEDPEK